MEYLPKSYQQKVTSAEDLAVSWLETRTPSEMATYKQIQTIAHDIIQEGLSEQVITPGVTSTTDVVWWYRDKIKELGLETWFHPTVDIQRSSIKSKEHLRTFDTNPDPEIIRPGDILHMDFGITYLRLNTDTQELAYVLKPDEKEVPYYLKEALAVGKSVTRYINVQF